MAGISAAIAVGLIAIGPAVAQSPGSGESAPAAPASIPSPVFPLKTADARIVDHEGRRVRLRSINWFGGESGAFVVGGLNHQPLARIARTIREGGFNSVRLPWSNELFEHDPPIDARYLTANPDLIGKTGMQVFDAVVDALGREGIMVILDNHRSRGNWCCDEQHGDGLWHTVEYPEQAWLDDWAAMARRYADRPFVVAAELRNEIRPDPSQSLVPTWGDGNPLTDWRAAAIRGGEAVLAANPRLLIVVGGTGYQEDLSNIRGAPIVLSVPDRLVYAAHDYSWWRTPEEVADPALFAAGAERRWAYLTEPGQPWSAPVYVSEWGGCTQPLEPSKPCDAHPAAYVFAFARYARDHDVDWAYWPLNGDQLPGYNRTDGGVEIYGLLDPTWSNYVNAPVMDALFGEPTR